MADYKTSKKALASVYPMDAVDAASFQRVEPVITPKQLRSRFLRGLPLVSPLTHEALKDSDIQDDIIQAINLVEFETMISIYPVQLELRLPFKYEDFQSFNFLEVPHKPILSVDRLAIVTASNQEIYQIPPDWIDNANFRHGRINVQAFTPTNLVGGSPYTLPSTGSQGGGFLLAGGFGSYRPGYWQIKLTRGFQMDQGIPVIINRIIGLRAAMMIITNLIPQYQLSSYSLGLDGVSQSQSNQAPQLFQDVLNRHQAEYEALTAKLKTMYNHNIFGTSI